ncbi:Flp pilus assembly protein TadG [Allocatelliglobosispora scoriae]|uniref:Flp pilus assembly protein TadG n=1 Tax=Allocatelliglobosispora scoriae TaxID=643052 RepID=A0A841BQK9_9ACTN|nr:hypothetical protein [Allocatelliglobosispora scoriae]MBB5869616.1 Flp pilus assembly protein TadG [Allocatelliglobosispora scoriae]
MMRIRRGRDAGAIAVYFAIIAPAWMAIVSLVIIGGGRVRAHEKAYNIAAEAARAAGQAIDPGSAILGQPKRINPGLAVTAAQNYLRAAGATGTVVVDSNQMLTVTARVTYNNPIGLSPIGGPTWTAIGKATATLVVR